MKSNYKEVKNYIHNEAGITKEEIREIIKEAVSFEVQRIVGERQAYIDKMVDEHTQAYIEGLIRNGISDGGRLLFGFKERVSSALSDAVGTYIATQLDINVQVKDKEDKDK